MKPLIFRNLLFYALLIAGGQVEAQFNQAYSVKETRILIILDGSGSMKELWQGKEKWEIAVELLYKTIDSIQQKHKNVDFGLRIFGHQSASKEKNCKDSNLEIPFTHASTSHLHSVLQAVKPKGWTPIAYSLMQAAQDFENNNAMHNSIILITDGLETCGGNICEAGQYLQSKKITLKPFVLGLGLKNNEKNFFDCAGVFFDVQDELSFEQALNVSIVQSLNPTTLQINLLNGSNLPVETDVEISVFDSHSKALQYNFIHALGKNNLPDTLYLDPKGKYDFKIHTLPPVVKSDVELVPGIHNVVAAKVPQGTILITSAQKKIKVQATIKQSHSQNTIYVQEVNSKQKYLTGIYDIEILTLPRILIKNYDLGPGVMKEIEVPVPGTLNISNAWGGIGSIFIWENEKMKLIYEYKKLPPKASIQLLPGKYIFVYRQDNVYESIYTKQEKFEIQSNQTTYLRW